MFTFGNPDDPRRLGPSRESHNRLFKTVWNSMNVTVLDILIYSSSRGIKIQKKRDLRLGAYYYHYHGGGEL